jgi:transcriptional regulator with XRE-family HTH domain
LPGGFYEDGPMYGMRTEPADAERLRALGAFIRTRREGMGITQTQLGRRLGYYQERISAIERGTYGLPTLPSLADLAAALEIDLSDLIEAAGFSLRQTAADGHSISGSA